MSYNPGVSDAYFENRNYEYYANNREKFEELKKTITQHLNETRQLADDFEKSQKEQVRLSSLINELKKEKTSSLDMLLLLKIIMSDDLSDFDLVSDQVIEEAKKRYPVNNYDATNVRHMQHFEIWLEGAAWMYYSIMTKRPSTAYSSGQLTLDDAIQHCKDVLPLCENDEVRKEHTQLKEWLEELKQYREWNEKRPSTNEMR